MDKYLLLLCSVLIVSCSWNENDSDYLEKIYFKQNWEHDGILFLSESANVLPINNDSLAFYLSSKEMQLALDTIAYPVDKNGRKKGSFYDSVFIPADTIYYRKVVFKNYGRVLKNDRFSLYTIYRSKEESTGRDHAFQLRAYDPNHKLIDTQLFAVWDDDQRLYLSGELTHDLKIKRLNSEMEAINCFRIDNNGRIEKIACDE